MYRIVLRMLTTAWLHVFLIGSVQLLLAARSVSSGHFGDSLLAEGLPQWLEKRVDYGGWPGFQQVDSENFPRHSPPVSIEANLARRAQERLDRILQYVDVAFPDDERSQTRMQYPEEVDGEYLPPSGKTTMKRDGQVGTKATVGAEALSRGGRQNKLNWYPIVLGIVGCVFLLLLAVGAGVAYNEKVRLPAKKSQREAEKNGVGRLSLDDDEGNVLRLDGDRKLAHSAQMYHYQYQKQQMLAVEKASEQDNHLSEETGDGSDSDVVEGDFTVYECPGLASTGELEVQNPLFQGDVLEKSSPTPSTDKAATSDPDEGSDSTPTGKTVQDLLG